MNNREAITRQIWETSNHGTCLVDIERAFDAGLASQAQQEPLQLPRNDTVLNLLARPNFGCIGIAEALRKKGHKIARSSESEQSEVIFWMLNLYLQHGDAWSEVGESYLKPPSLEGGDKS